MAEGSIRSKAFEQSRRIADKDPSLVDHALSMCRCMRMTASVALRLARKPNCVLRRRLSASLPTMRPNMSEARTLYPTANREIGL
eukprot:9249278-Pyramimonas_sp.AAC.1